MKLITCEKCLDVVNLVESHTRTCHCGEIAGKYLDDRVTAVVSSKALVMGIDNNGWNIAKHMVKNALEKEIDFRVDYFFVGWIPTIPGEVIVVDSVYDVYDYDDHVENPEYTSTLPTEGMD